MDDRIGQHLGNYRLIRLLGRGGFAHVYLGVHLRLETLAAIKVVSTHLSSDDVEKLLVEARTIARLEHPHIVRILDFDVDNGVPFIVMNYAPNGSLRQRYPRHTRLPLETILTYLKQTADALQYAHDARLVHRDVKPENMLLGQRNEILLSDFGVAVVVRSSHSQSTMEVAGTVTYIAPEQIQGKPRPASDQYALGVIVYEWLCGNPPFRGTPAELTSQHMLAPPTPLREQCPDISPAIEAVVLKALEKDPHHRFASVLEFASAFEQAYHEHLSLPTVSSLSPPSNATIPSIPSGQPQGQVLLSAVTSLPTSKDLPRQRRLSRRLLVLGSVALLGVAGAGTIIAWPALSSSQVSHKEQKTQESTIGHTITTFTGHANIVKCVAWSRDGTHVASGGDFLDQTVQIWDAATGMRAFTYRVHHSDINALVWEPDGLRIASASGNGFFRNDKENNVYIWNSSDGALISSYKGHSAPVTALAWSRGGGRIASGSDDKTVQIWDAATGKPRAPYLYSGHTGPIRSIAWSRDGKRIASASADQTVQIWDADTGKLLFSLKHPASVNGVDWSPDDKRVVSACGVAFGSSEHNVQIWDATTGLPILTYNRHTASVNAVAWSRDGKRIASASGDKTVQVWDAATGAILFTYRGHTAAVNALTWSPNDKFIASASSDGTVRVWQAP